MEKIQAIVIKSSNRKEKDKNILLFSIENGKIWATLKGVKGENAKMKLAQSPFCFAEFILEDGKMGKIVTGLDVVETFHELSEDVDKYFEGSAVLEVINAFDFSSEQERASVFVLMLKTLKTICFSNARPLYALNKFFLELFKMSGVPLYVDKCSCCGSKSFEKLYMNYLVGQLECISCKSLTSEELPKVVLSALKLIDATEFERLNTLKLAADSELSLLKVLVKNFEARFEKRLNLIGILK